MSTRSSLFYGKWKQQPLQLHVYNEMLNDCYYITDEINQPILLPSEEISKEIAAILRKHEEKE